MGEEGTVNDTREYGGWRKPLTNKLAVQRLNYFAQV